MELSTLCDLILMEKTIFCLVCSVVLSFLSAAYCFGNVHIAPYAPSTPAQRCRDGLTDGICPAGDAAVGSHGDLDQRCRYYSATVAPILPMPVLGCCAAASMATLAIAGFVCGDLRIKSLADDSQPPGSMRCFGRKSPTVMRLGLTPRFAASAVVRLVSSSCRRIRISPCRHHDVPVHAT
jgi:hypothetical protein